MKPSRGSPCDNADQQMKKVSLFTFASAVMLSASAHALSLDEIQFWTGAGTNRAVLVVQWSAPEFRNNSSVESPVANKSFAWGFRWNGSATAEDMLNAIAAADPRFVPVISPPTMFGISVLGFAFDLNGNGVVGIRNGTNAVTKSSSNGSITLNTGSADVYQGLDAGDLYWGGWNGPTWELWSGINAASGGTNSPDRGANRYWTPDDPDAPYSGAHGEWQLASGGISGLELTNGLWVGYSVAAGGLDFFNPDTPGNVAYDHHKHAPKPPVAIPLPVSPYATAITKASGPFGNAPYDDPNAVLGMPSTDFYDPFGVFDGGDNPRIVKLVEAAFNVGTNQSTKLITTLSSSSSNSFIIAEFAQPIQDDPAHPYGIDFLVFGNAFYTGNGAVHDEANMNTLIMGGGFVEPLKVSVSPGFTGLPGEVMNDPATWPWHLYDNGPFADTAFPTHAYKWNRSQTNWSAERMDFTKPVNPSFGELMTSGISAADGIDYYTGSGGGTGFDLKQSGFTSVRYVKVEGIAPDFSDGEVDAFAVVRPATLNDEISIAPANLTNGMATVRFQQPGAPSQLAAAVTFSSLTNLARVRAAVISNPEDRAGLPAGVLGATRVDVLPALSNGTVNFSATLALGTSGYVGAGNDLHLFRRSGTNWIEQSLTYASSNHTVLIPDLTNNTAFAVVQTPVVPIAVTMTNGFALRFNSVAGWTHYVERTLDFVSWTNVATIAATTNAPMTVNDTNAPAAQSFYRLRLELP
jgi:hypothetical protein